MNWLYLAHPHVGYPWTGCTLFILMLVTPELVVNYSPSCWLPLNLLYFSFASFFFFVDLSIFYFTLWCQYSAMEPSKQSVSRASSSLLICPYFISHSGVNILQWNQVNNVRSNRSSPKNIQAASTTSERIQILTHFYLYWWLNFSPASFQLLFLFNLLLK